MSRSELVRWARGRPTDWRYGQALWNYAERAIGPEVRKRFVSSEVDCFYDDGRADAFLDALESAGLLDGAA